MTVKLKCPVCGSMGTLMQKTTKTKTTTGRYKEYRYWYVYHGKKAKKPWCYLTKEDLEKPEIKEAIEELTTQTATQTDTVTTQTESVETHNQRSSEITSFQKSGSLLLLSPKSLYMDSAKSHLSIPSMKCPSPFSIPHIFGQRFYWLFRGIHSILPRLPYCKFCISLLFLLSSFKGQSGLKHSLQGLRPLICTRTSGHPQEPQFFPMGLAVPR